MADSFIGEIRVFGFNFAPRNWAFCNGQLLAITQNTALFSILGTSYGGDGRTTFALPNFQGRSGLQFGSGPGLSSYVLGEESGTPTTTLLSSQIPAHRHAIATREGQTATQNLHAPTSAAFLGISTPAALYAAATPQMAMDVRAIGTEGNSQAHNNMQPYLALNFCISLYGQYPPHQ